MLVGRVFASEKAFAAGFCTPIAQMSTIALTNPSARDTSVPEAMTALARPMPPRVAATSAIASLGGDGIRGLRLVCRFTLTSGPAARDDEAQQPRDEDQHEHDDHDERADALPFGVHGDARVARVERHACRALDRGEHG